MSLSRIITQAFIQWWISSRLSHGTWINPKAVLKLSQFVIFVERYCWRFLPHLQKYMILPGLIGPSGISGKGKESSEALALSVSISSCASMWVKKQEYISV